MGKKQRLKQQRKIEEQQKKTTVKKQRKGIFLSVSLFLFVLAAGLVLVWRFLPKSEEKAPNQFISEEVVNATIKTAKGDIVLELFPERAPQTVENFTKLAKENFYDGIKFHRVIPDFMVQGGDPLTKDTDPANDGFGDPGYLFEDEINPESLGLSEEVIAALEGEGYKYRQDIQSLPHTPGVISMANSGPNTNGSQFFIVTTKDQPHLNGKHTVFGRVIEGLEVAKTIEQGDVIERIVVR